MKRITRKFLLALMLCSALVLVPPSAAWAAGDGIDVEVTNARDYIPSPAGTLYLPLYYEHVSANSFYVGGHSTSPSPSLYGNVGLFRPVYFVEWGPFVIDPELSLPFAADFKVTDPYSNAYSFSKIGDLTLFGTVWFLHNKASMTYMGITQFYTIPVGDYSREPGLNPVSGNRWKFQYELGFVKGFSVIPGHNAWVELIAGGVFQTNNNNATNPFTGLRDTKSTAPILETQVHLSYDITSKFWTAVDYYFASGGKDSFRGTDVPNSSLNTHTIGGTVAYNFFPFQALLQYKQDIGIKNGFKEHTILFRFLYICDLKSLFGGSKSHDHAEKTPH